MYKASSLILDWSLISPPGPKVAFHTACVIQDGFYIHGGLVNEKSNIPVNGFHRLDLNTNIWNEIRADGSPCLSHHTCVVLKNRYMVIIGGWDGRYRTSYIHCFDVDTQQWTEIKHSGYPKEAGLSSHTAVLCQNDDVLVIGREGSLHSHRRHSSAYTLSGNIDKKVFHFSLLTYKVDSRSGHTCTGMGQSIYLVGGRNDRLVEKIEGINALPQLTNTAAEKLRALCGKLVPMSKPPVGRKRHIAVGGHGVIFIHGGQTFDGRNKEPIGEMYIIIVKKSLSFYKVGVSPITREGHVCCCYGDKIILHGGVTGKTYNIQGDTYELNLV